MAVGKFLTPSHRAAHDTAAGFSQTQESEAKAGLHYLLSPKVGRHMPSLSLYSSHQTRVSKSSPSSKRGKLGST